MEQSTTDYGSMTQDEIALVACYAAVNAAALGLGLGNIVTGHATWNGQTVQVVGVQSPTGESTPLGIILNTQEINKLQWLDDPFVVTPDIGASALVGTPHGEAFNSLTARASETPDTFADDYKDDDISAMLSGLFAGAYADDSGDERSDEDTALEDEDL